MLLFPFSITGYRPVNHLPFYACIKSFFTVHSHIFSINSIYINLNWLMMDIKDFFDNVKSYMILDFDEKSAKEPYLFHRDDYAAQGFASSPMIANIAILPALTVINDVLKEVYDDRYGFTIYADDIQKIVD